MAWYFTPNYQDFIHIGYKYLGWMILLSILNRFNFIMLFTSSTKGRDSTITGILMNLF